MYEDPRAPTVNKCIKMTGAKRDVPVALCIDCVCVYPDPLVFQTNIIFIGVFKQLINNYHRHSWCIKIDQANVYVNLFIIFLSNLISSKQNIDLCNNSATHGHSLNSVTAKYSTKKMQTITLQLRIYYHVLLASGNTDQIV